MRLSKLCDLREREEDNTRYEVTRGFFKLQDLPERVALGKSGSPSVFTERNESVNARKEVPSCSFQVTRIFVLKEFE